MNKVKKIIAIILIIIGFVLVGTITGLATKSTTKNEIVQYMENPTEWRECYLVCVLYGNNKYVLYNTHEYSYKAIYIKFDDELAYIKLVDREGNERVIEEQRNVQCIIANYK